MSTPPFYAKTLAKRVTFEGVGIHSGLDVTLTCMPSKDLSKGLYVVRTDQNNAELALSPAHFSHTKRASILSNAQTEIQTPEHLLSACHALGISHARFELSGAECPILDGSSTQFVEAFSKAGFALLRHVIEPITISAPILLRQDGWTIMAVPDTTFKISYILDYPNHFIGQQSCHIDVYRDNYASKIAPARTYGFYEEVKALYEQNLAQGGSFDNAVVIGKDDYMNELRFPDELVRHKVLDMIGDLWVLQRPLHMHIFGVASGHEANRQLARALC